MIAELANKWKENSFKNIVSKLCFGAAVYHIWKARNDICFGKGGLPRERIQMLIQDCVRVKVSCLEKVNKTSENVLIANNWGIPHVIFE